MKNAKRKLNLGNNMFVVQIVLFSYYIKINCVLVESLKEFYFVAITLDLFNFTFYMYLLFLVICNFWLFFISSEATL